MKDTTVAARYAKALFIVTENRGETVPALDDLRGMQQLLTAGTPVGTLLTTPQVKLADKRQALKTVLQGKVMPAVVLFIDLLLRKKRLRELDQIALEFEALVENKQGIQRAHLVSAVPLLPAELDRARAELEQLTSRHIQLTTAIDPALLGGAFVKIGDRVIDRTVKTLLERIEYQLLETSV